MDDDPIFAENLIHIRPGLNIPLDELEYRFSRSSGPGGQHVQRSATRVELLWAVARSPSIGDEQRARLLHRLASQIDGDGVLRLVSQNSRSQFRNRTELIERFRLLVASALIERRSRRATRPTRSSQERRLSSKKRRGEIKRWRSGAE